GRDLIRRMLGPLAARLEEVAARRPDRVAVSAKGHSITVGELWKESGRRAAEWTRREVGAAGIVLLMNPNSVDWLITLVTALRSDRTIAVVDPKLPADQAQDLRR